MSFVKKAFAQKGQCNRHYKLVHQRIKEFQCELCETRFSIKQDMQVHHESVHEPWSYYKCFCGIEKPTKKHMQHHLRTVHNGIQHAPSLKKLDKETADSIVKCEIIEIH